MRTKWALHPADYRLGENESFYADQAARGWKLEKRGGYFSSFTRVNPKREMYRVELDPREPTAEKLALYEECGWEWVTKRDTVNVYRAPEGSGAPELYTDAEGLAGSIRRIRRRYVRDFLLLTVLLPLLVWGLFALGESITDFRAGYIIRWVLYPEDPAFWLAIILYELAGVLMGLFCTGRLLRDIRRGKMPDHAPRVRRPWGKLLLMTVWALCLLTLILQLALHRRTEMPEVSDGPYVTLAELGFDGERTGLFGGEPEGNVSRDWSPLCRILETSEDVKAGDDVVFLDTHLYDLRLPWGAESFTRALISKSYFTHDPDGYERIEVPGWDTVLVCYRECFARAGRRVVQIYLSAPGEFDRDTQWALFEKLLTRLADR